MSLKDQWTRLYLTFIRNPLSCYVIKSRGIKRILRIYKLVNVIVKTYSPNHRYFLIEYKKVHTNFIM